MKKNCLTLFIFIFLLKLAFSQINYDSTFTIHNTNYSFDYKKISKSRDLRRLKIQKNTPVYVFGQDFMRKLQTTLNTYSKNNNDLTSINKIAKLDIELCDKQKIYLDSIISFQTQRIELYKSSYTELLKICDEYKKQLDDCIVISRKKNRKRKTIIGIIGGVLGGFVIGYIVAD